MLLELVVENYAVVDRIRVRFHPGLNLLTGETGSGKSIVVDALGLLFGGRASAEMVRSGEARARVAGIFDVRDHPRVRALLEPAGFQAEDGELLIEREILAGGKSRAFLGSRPVAAGLLRELATFLGDIHGQHDQQSLFVPDAQREMLDSFAGERGGALPRRRRFTGSGARRARNWRNWSAPSRRSCGCWTSGIFSARRSNRRRPSRARMRRSKPSGGCSRTWAGFRRTRARRYASLYDSPESAMVQVRTAFKRLDELCRIDPGLGAIRENVQAADLALQEASFGLRDYLGKLEANPGRLDEIETRLAGLDRLKRKYGRSIEEVVAFLAEVRGQIEAVEHAGERMEELRALPGQTRRGIREAGRGADRAPQGRRRKLEKRVEEELASLAMERTVFRVEIAPGAWSEERRRRGAVPGVAERGRGAQADGKGGVGRRNFAPRAGAQDVPGGAAPCGGRPRRRARWYSTKWTPGSAAAPRRAWGGD